MDTQKYIEADAHHWATLTGSSELLPAITKTADRRTQSLNGLPWLGETPSMFGITGIARRIPGWAELNPSANEVRQWAREGHNILCQHRWVRGIRLNGSDAFKRFGELQRRVQDFVREPFLPPLVQAPDGSVTFMVETPITVLATRHTPKASLLGHGATTVIAGVDAHGRPYRSWHDPDSWGPPQISASYFAHLWHLYSGLPTMKLPDLSASAARMGLLLNDPAAQNIEANGWATGFRKEGMEIRCPFHPNAFTPALYTPASSARGKPRIVCPLCPRNTPLGAFIDAMESK